MIEKNKHITFIRYFYDVMGKLSEDDVQKIALFGNSMYMLFMVTLLVTFLLSLLSGHDIMGYGVFLVFCLAAYRQEKLIKELGLNRFEITAEEKGLAYRKMFRRTLLHTLGLFLYASFIVFALWHSGIPSESGTSFETYWQIAAPLTILGGTMIGFVSFYFANRRKIHVIGA